MAQACKTDTEMPILPPLQPRQELIIFVADSN